MNIFTILQMVFLGIQIIFMFLSIYSSVKDNFRNVCIFTGLGTLFFIFGAISFILGRFLCK